MKSDIQIIPYTKSFQKWFEKFNRDWIEKYFWMEPLDIEILQDPENLILSKGGKIFIAKYLNEVAGTVALKFAGQASYELMKMALDERFQGKGIGRALATTAIAEAKGLKANRIFLYSSSKLTTALSLYRKLGFVDLPVDGPYKRSDVKMELLLKY